MIAPADGPHWTHIQLLVWLGTLLAGSTTVLVIFFWRFWEENFDGSWGFAAFLAFLFSTLCFGFFLVELVAPK